MEITAYEPGTPCWVDLGTPDIEAACRFYGGLFGWNIPEGSPETGDYRNCTMRGLSVAGIGPLQMEGQPPSWTTYVAVADADATAKAVAGAGGQVLAPPMDVMKFGRMAVFADPSGAAFSVWQSQDHVGSQVVNEPGAPCWHELATRGTDASVTFYGDVFDWGTATQPMGTFDYTEWKVGDRTVGGMVPMDVNWPAEVPAHWMVYFAVADTDAAAARATELGGTVSVPPTDIPPGRFAVLTDPHGARFSIIAFGQAQ